MDLYQKYGGFSSINKLVMAFYNRLLDSDEVGPYFEDVDMSRLIDHQTKFMAMLLGGPASFTDEQLRNAHSSIGITHTHFDELKVILFDTLCEHGIETHDADTVLKAIESRRVLIVQE